MIEFPLVGLTLLIILYAIKNFKKLCYENEWRQITCKCGLTFKSKKYNDCYNCRIRR